MSARKTNRIPRNQGRIEIIACQETILSFMERGMDRKKIFEQLRKNGSISMAYSTFCKVLSKWMQPQTQKSIPGPAQKLPTPAALGPGPQILENADKKSVDPKKYSNESLTI